MTSYFSKPSSNDSRRRLDRDWGLADRFCHRPFAQEIAVSLFEPQALLSPHQYKLDENL
jgi:hypothetical protein